jgi:large subunit ribosomal protein L46
VLAHSLYQRRLNERLVLPFTQYLYYKRGTPSFEHWRKFKTARGGVAGRDIGNYNAYTPESWNDEVLVGEEVGTPDKVMRSLINEEGRQEEFVGQSGLRDTAGLRRRTEADEKNDTRSLERSLDRTLYLVVRNKTPNGKDNWAFPAGELEGREGLHNVS